MVFITHLSDLHVGSMSFREELILDAIDKINEMGPDATVVTGDLSDNGYYQELKQAADYVEQIKTPLLVVPGNHRSWTISAMKTLWRENQAALPSTSVPIR